MVKAVGPVTMHIQALKTGRKYAIGLPSFLKMPVNANKADADTGKVAVDLRTLAARKRYFNKHGGARTA